MSLLLLGNNLNCLYISSCLHNYNQSRCLSTPDTVTDVYKLYEVNFNFSTDLPEKHKPN